MYSLKKCSAAIFMAIMVCVMAACSSSDDDVVTVTYSMGFSSVQASNLSEMSVIEDAYKEALGTSSTQFTRTGTVSNCDRDVIAACKVAEGKLMARSQTWSGSYEFTITNANSLSAVYSYSYGK